MCQIETGVTALWKNATIIPFWKGHTAGAAGIYMRGEGIQITYGPHVVIIVSEIKQILQDMAKEYSEKQRGIQLVFLEDSVQLCTKPQYYEYLIRIASRPQKQVLSDSVLETLSIVAYKQPVTRGEIERIRGVKSDHAIAKLMDYDLIEEIGRLDAPFATTEEFLRCFGVSSVAELPQAAPEQIMEFKEEAESEIPVTV